jgi:hypothetical protein
MAANGEEDETEHEAAPSGAKTGEKSVPARHH